MKTLTFVFVGIICLSFTACNENKVIEQESGKDQLGAMVHDILKEENLEEAIWNPEGMNLPDVPTIQVKSEEELRELIKDLSAKAQEFGKTIEHVNQVNQRRYDAFQKKLATSNNRKDSLRIAMEFPEIVYLRDTTELIDFGLIERPQTN